MPDWKQRKYVAGSEVSVTGIDNSHLGVGVLLYDYDIDTPEDNVHPEIRMPDGTIVLGCECWWIPLNEIPEHLTPATLNLKGKHDRPSQVEE